MMSNIHSVRSHVLMQSKIKKNQGLLKFNILYILQTSLNPFVQFNQHLKKKNMKKLLLYFAIILCCLPYSGSAQQNQNLLVNPGCYDGGTTGWNVTSSSDDGWIEDLTGGTDGTSCWVSSYSNTTKSEDIDLIAIGYTPTYLDQQPIILYAESYKGFDGGSSLSDEYQLNIYLMDDNGNVLYTYQSGVLTCNGTWQSLKGAIRNYGTGVRKIRYEHIGNCANFWAGNYGAMIDDSHLSIGNNIYYAGGKTHSLAGWTIDANGGDGWLVDPNGLYLTSWDMNTKSQMIDLLAQGYSTTELDQEPLITYGEFALGTQPNFADYYNQTVRLLDANFVEITSNSQNPTLTDQWQWIGGSFSSYGPGLRYIKYEHSGMDVEFFLGHYGATMDYALVQLGASTTSVADVADKQFNFVLSPNPTNGNFNVSLQNLTTASNAILTISDLQGRVVYSDNIENKSQNNLTHSYQLNQLLSKGVYMVSLGDENSTITRKLVIQ